MTADASAITETGATSGGTVDAATHAGASQKGVCWNTTGMRTTSNPKTTEGSGTHPEYSHNHRAQPGQRHHIKYAGKQRKRAV